MQKSSRKKQNSALQTPAFMSSSSPASSHMDSVHFHLDLWLYVTVHSWVLDVGRTVVMLVLSGDICPLNRPGVADYLHLLYIVTLPLVLLRMLECSHRTLPPVAVHLCVIAVVMGTSFRLVADSITCRLLLVGFQLQLTVRENLVMMKLRPLSLVDAFELLFYYDDTLGHVMWSVPLFLILLLFFNGCFCHRTQEQRLPPAAWMLLTPNAAYYWYLMTEGQTFIIFIFTCFAVTATVMQQRRRGFVPDANGLFMLYSFSGALLLLLLWVTCLWNDPSLRKRHPGLIYVPQPRVVYALHLHRVTGSTPT